MGLVDTHIDTAKFVVLRGLKEGNRFYSINVPGHDPRLSAKGKLWYDIIGYANSSEEALSIILNSHSYPRVVDDSTG